MLISEKHLMPVTERPPLVMVRGQGSYLWDDSGKRYLDCLQGWATNALGHAAPELVSALTHQAEQLWSPSPAFHNGPQLELAKRLTDLSGLDRVVFATSGAEANDAAIKLCRKWGRVHKRGAHKIITTERAFHGRTLATMAASGKPGWDAMFPPNLPGFQRVEFGNIDAVANALDDSVVAVMLEPIQGEAGVRVPPKGYLATLRELTAHHDCLLVFDEIQTGMGRTGNWFAKDYFGVQPDVMTLGKALGSGIPISALLSTERASCFARGEYGGTHAGNPLLASVAIAVIEVMSQTGFFAGVSARGEQLNRGLQDLARRHGAFTTRGVGLLQAIEFEAPMAAAVRDQALELGLLVNAAQPNVLRLAPSLRVTASEVDECIELLDSALARLNVRESRPDVHKQGSEVYPTRDASLPRQQRQVT